MKKYIPCNHAGFYGNVGCAVCIAVGDHRDLIHRGLVSFIEKEIRLADEDIADLMDRYNVASKEDLFEAISSKKISSHPAWED